jgi:predicted CoA-binding protein
MAKPTLVLGASENPQRYAYLAVNKLLAYGHPVMAIGKKAGRLRDVEILTGHPPLEAVDTITLYLNPANQKPYYEYLLSLHPKRIIFNPGTENDELMDMARAQGIQALEACTLVMLSTGQY